MRRTLQQALEMIHRQEKPPEHLANSLYLEWFSEANGRVVVESADYQLTISAPEWRLTPEEDAERARQAAETHRPIQIRGGGDASSTTVTERLPWEGATSSGR